MATSYEAYLPYVLTDTPGCPEIVAIQAIRNAVIEFCERSLVLQRDHDPVGSIAGVTDYEFEPPTGYLVAKLMRAWYLNTELTPLAPDMVTDPTIYNPLIDSSTDRRADPRSILQKDERTFSLYPTPKTSVPNAITMRVALKPSRSTVSADDVLFEDYAEFIAAGAKARLCSMSGKPYNNPQAAALGNAMFVQGINRALQRGVRGHTRSGLGVTLRRI